MADDNGTDTGAAPQETPAGTPPPATTEPATGEETLADAGKQALDRMKAERNAATSRAKALERELEQHRKASMTESEKAVAEAVARGRGEATALFAERLVRAEYLAAAAKRNPGFDAAGVLDDLNLARFASEDGEPDSKAIAASVERLVPAASSTTSFDGGARTSPQKAPNMNDLIRGLGSR